jgi:predicted 2-oxoglutarate/Fe(II)-dependent dioxygenase YbiX
MLPFGLSVGDPVFNFIGRNAANPRFTFDTLAGRWVMVLLPGSLGEPGKAARLGAMLGAGEGVLDPAHAVLVTIGTDPADERAGRLADGHARRVLWDDDGSALRALKAARPDGMTWEGWVLLDPTLRVFGLWPLADGAEAMATLAALPPPEAHAGTALSAPALIVPRVFEPDFCRALIAFYEAEGGGESGFMRDVDGRTVGMMDPSMKRRRDAFVGDAALQAEMRARLAARLLPEIRRAFNFRVTRVERYVVACYDEADRGFFSPHRDNSTRGTAHRRFAVTINLNTGEYEGGALRFPEFGQRSYVAPAGGAIVFSCALLHEALPVTRGRRYACLPFLYDEEGERFRLENLRFLGDNEAFRAPPPPGAAATQRAI